MKSNFKKTAFFFLFICALGATMSIFSQDNGMSFLSKKPVFKVKVNTFGVKYNLEVNGVAVLQEFSADSQLTTTLPVNHFFHPEKNMLGVSILPEKPGADFNPNSYFELDLVVSEHDGDEMAVIRVLDFNGSGHKSGKELDKSVGSGRYTLKNGFNPDVQGEVEIHEFVKEGTAEYEGAIIYKREITIPNSLPLWAFFTSDDLPDYYAMSDEPYYAAKDEFFLAYEKLHVLLQSGNVDKIVELCRERNKEVDQAFYLRKGETEEKLRRSLKEDINNSELELVPLTAEMVDITLENNRKLASLTRNGNTSALAFDIKTGGSMSYPVVFRRDRGKWVITR